MSQRRQKERTEDELLETMGLDVLMFQTDKDGNPAAIKASQRARFKSEEIVDEIQEDYKQWTRGRHMAIPV